MRTGGESPVSLAPVGLGPERGSSRNFQRPSAFCATAVLHFPAPSARPSECRRWGTVFRRATDQPEAEVLSVGAPATFRAAVTAETRDAPWNM